MGLFDGQVKNFAGKIVSALRERAQGLNQAASGYSPGGPHYERHVTGALILAEIANVIAAVAELE